MTARLGRSPELLRPSEARHQKGPLAGISARISTQFQPGWARSPVEESASNGSSPFTKKNRTTTASFQSLESWTRESVIRLPSISHRSSTWPKLNNEPLRSQPTRQSAWQTTGSSQSVPGPRKVPPCDSQHPSAKTKHSGPAPAGRQQAPMGSQALSTPSPLQSRLGSLRISHTSA